MINYIQSTTNGNIVDVMEKKRELRLFSEDINDYLKCDPIVIFADPDIEVVKTLQSYDSRENLWDNLPMKLGYEMCL